MWLLFSFFFFLSFFSSRFQAGGQSRPSSAPGGGLQPRAPSGGSALQNRSRAGPYPRGVRPKLFPRLYRGPRRLPTSVTLPSSRGAHVREAPPPPARPLPWPGSAAGGAGHGLAAAVRGRGVGPVPPPPPTPGRHKPDSRFGSGSVCLPPAWLRGGGSHPRCPRPRPRRSPSGQAWGGVVASQQTSCPRPQKPRVHLGENSSERRQSPGWAGGSAELPAPLRRAAEHRLGSARHKRGPRPGKTASKAFFWLKGEKKKKKALPLNVYK